MIRHVVLAISAVTGLAAIRAVGAPAYGADQKSSVQQADRSQQECIARRQREGLNIRFAVHRCVNPNN